MGSRLVDQGVGAVLAQAMSQDPAQVLIVNPGEHTTRSMIDELDAGETETEVRILATRNVLKDVLSDFLVASVAADLVEQGHLDLRSGAEDAENALIITPTEIIALIKMDGEVAGLSTDDADFVRAVSENYDAYWEHAEPYPLRTPSISRVRNTLEAEIGDAAEQDFSQILESIDSARGDGQDLDEVTISLLVAARNEALLYDISKWGEDVGIASKATFSRTKTELEDQGVIETEKVPIDVGRPRLRLKLANERLASSQADELADETLELIG